VVFIGFLFYRIPFYRFPFLPFPNLPLPNLPFLFLPFPLLPFTKSSGYGETGEKMSHVRILNNNTTTNFGMPNREYRPSIDLTC